MGYRFSFDSANTIANLITGKVNDCYNKLISDPDFYSGFLNLLERFKSDFFSNRKDYYQNIINNLINGLETFYGENRKDTEKIKQIKADLNSIHNLLSECQYKALLLPKAFKEENNFSNDFMQNENLLRRIVEYHPDNSCLILQLHDQMGSYRHICLLNAFPYFDKALKRIHEWPAVLLWNEMGSIFLPVKKEADVIDLFHCLRQKNHDNNEKLFMLREFEKKFERCERTQYILHISDLHFNGLRMQKKITRLKRLLRNQINKINNRENINIVITGDIVDSPNGKNYDLFIDFKNDIINETGKEPIIILGNHDVNKKGIAYIGYNQRAIFNSNFSICPIILENEHLIFLPFNSNTNGHLAQGEIGEAQMLAMGNALDGIPNLEKYNLIAILHHHIAEIPKPEWYACHWYEKLFPESFDDYFLKLNDADTFITWLKQRNVKIVLHGHKHIPYYDASNEDLHIIACGSSTGQVKHKEKNKTYLSYNLIIINGNNIVCQQFAEDLIGAGEKNIKNDAFQI